MFTGSGVAIVTPFNEDKTINFERFRDLVEFQISGGTDAIIVAGTTGEASTMTADEQLELIKRCVEIVNKRVPVIAGTGSNNTAHALHLSKKAEEYGVDGLLVVTPYYNKTNRAGLINHFTTIADSVNVPIMLYNVPGRTGMNIPVDVLKELSNHKNIVALKDASGDISYSTEVARICRDAIDIYSGNDDIIIPVMSVGGKGVVSVLANILPKETHDMVMDYLNGDVAKALKAQLDLNGVTHALFTETNPIPVKAALNLMDFNMGGYRAPLYEISPEGLETLRTEMKKINLI